jgi:hypothetical protein
VVITALQDEAKANMADINLDTGEIQNLQYIAFKDNYGIITMAINICSSPIVSFGKGY